MNQNACRKFSGCLEKTPAELYRIDISLKKLKLTFTSIPLKNALFKTGNKEFILEAYIIIVLKSMTLIAQDRQLSLKEVLTHPLGLLPWALASPDGSTKKTANQLWKII